MTPLQQPPCAQPQAEREQAHALMLNMGFTFSRDNRIFIISAQIYLMIGGLGLAMNGTFLSDLSSRPAFLHFFSLGFLAFMMYGLGAHMLPRFTGNPLPNTPWVWIQMGCAHLGVLAYTTGYLLGLPLPILCGATLAWTAMLIFAVRIWQILWRHD